MNDKRRTMNEERIPHMLYYVKTDRLFNSLEVEVDDRKFYFDASCLEHKRANEKRELVYELTGKRDDGYRGRPHPAGNRLGWPSAYLDER